MKKLAVVLLVCAGVCWSGSVWAQLFITVTPAGTSGCPPTGVVAACPAGDMDWFQVTVQEVPPAPGSIITVTVNPVAGLCICPGQSPQSAVEGAGGAVTLSFWRLGGCVGVSFTAVTTTPGVLPVTSPRFPMISPDINGDCIVNLVDFGIFAQNFLGTWYCCDYNCDGVVNLIDFAIFARHFTHWC